MSLSPKYIESWGAFKVEFGQQILPIYHKHERSFDPMGIHGRRHISRALLWAEAMARYYQQTIGISIDFDGMRRAIAFHDAGRKGNGRDVWEQQSSDLCYNYLLAKGGKEAYSREVANSILKKKKTVDSLLSQIVYDADVFEILRLFVRTKNGLYKFRQTELFFLSDIDLTKSIKIGLRNEILQEIWQFIQLTEKGFPSLRTEEYLDDYLQKITGSNAYPLLTSLLG